MPAVVDSLAYSASAIGWLSVQLGTDGSAFDRDAPLPPTPENNARRIGRQALVDPAAREGLKVRQRVRRVGGYGGLAFVGTPAAIADGMRECLEAGARDGFTMMFPYLPAGLDDCAEGVLPELQRRGLFRREYAGRIAGPSWVTAPR